MKRYLILIGLAFSLFGCASNPLRQVWTTPDIQAIAPNKTAVMALLSSETERRIAEDVLSKELAVLKPLASYPLPDGLLHKDIQQAKNQFARQGFDYAVVAKLIGTHQELSYGASSLPMYGGFWGFYGRRAALYYETLKWTPLSRQIFI